MAPSIRRLASGATALLLVALLLLGQSHLPVPAAASQPQQQLSLLQQQQHHLSGLQLKEDELSRLLGALHFNNGGEPEPVRREQVFQHLQQCNMYW